MPNWFGRNYPQKNQNSKSRWSFSVEADVWVPQDIEDEKEKNTAERVLKTVLDKASGDASLHTAIESNIQFDIQFEPIKR